MTKPHEETWTHRIYRGEVQLDGYTIAVFGEGDERGEAFAEVRARAQLATMAPAMARLLLRYHAVSHHACPSCGKFGPIEHAERCELQAVLKDAGVLA